VLSNEPKMNIVRYY